MASPRGSRPCAPGTRAGAHGAGHVVVGAVDAGDARPGQHGDRKDGGQGDQEGAGAAAGGEGEEGERQPGGRRQRADQPQHRMRPVADGARPADGDAEQRSQGRADRVAAAPAAAAMCQTLSPSRGVVVGEHLQHRLRRRRRRAAAAQSNFAVTSSQARTVPAASSQQPGSGRARERRRPPATREHRAAPSRMASNSLQRDVTARQLRRVRPRSSVSGRAESARPATSQARRRPQPVGQKRARAGLRSGRRAIVALMPAPLAQDIGKDPLSRTASVRVRLDDRRCFSSSI